MIIRSGRVIDLAGELPGMLLAAGAATIAALTVLGTAIPFCSLGAMIGGRA